MRVLKYLSFILMLVALLGFYQSSLLHWNTVFNPTKTVIQNWWFLSFFFVWFPAIFAVSELINKSSEKDYFRVIIGDDLSWIKYIILGLFIYTFTNFHFCKFLDISVAGNSNLSNYWQIRGGSSFLMFGYLIATLILYRFWRS